MGGLDQFFSGVANHLQAGGYFGFSSETQPDERFAGRDFMVGDYQRFAHAQSYVRALLSAHGMECIRCEDIVVRSEQGSPVPDIYISLSADNIGVCWLQITELRSIIYLMQSKCSV